MNKQRGKGKISGSLKIKDIYKSFRKINLNDKINKTLFSNILETFHIILSKKVLEENEEIKFPHIGTLRIKKFKKKLNPESKKKWSIDWKKTKELGFKVFHEEKFGYRWTWKRNNIIYKNKSLYKFLSSRTNSREIKKQIEIGKDYFM